MKTALLATALMLLASASSAWASWAETANMRYPYYTGTDRALARAQHGLDPATTAHRYRPYYRHHWHRYR